MARQKLRATSRRYYLFDWEGDGETDHVGIVENAKTVSFTPWKVTLATLAGKINIRLEAAPSMVTAFLPTKNGQKKNQRFIPLALLPYIVR